MRKFLTAIAFCALPLYLTAGITTYTFTSANWSSRVDATVCDGLTDGWVCDKQATEYCSGRTDAQGRLYSQGVGVKTGTSGAGATSVIEFEDVRRITVNFCQNSSKGKGVIYMQIGDNEPLSITVNKPASSGEGVYNRDSVIQLATPQTGKIRFWVTCSENAIYINTLTIRSAAGGSSVFTTDTYQLVTDTCQLQDSDQVVIGVFKEGVNYVMGYFDEYESVNNIHAIKARYSADRSQVDADERSIYTLRITRLDGKTAYIFQDELRYEQAFLVASGGQTKNRLAVWSNIVDEGTYGNYGLWDILISNGGEAVITNLGNSLAKIIQYNASNNPTLFACYQNRSQTPVCLYRRVEAMGDIPAIVAPFVNFGTTTQPEGERTIQVNANRLTEDISASLLSGEVFALSAGTLDRDGDRLTITYHAENAGHYTDTLVLRSGSTETRVALVLNRTNPMTVSEAVRQEDYTTLFLNDVVVTKKYNNYIYIRDETGSMLLFDRGDGETGKRYGADVKAGDRLSDVTGRFINYFGVPEITPTEAFGIGANTDVEPEPAGATIDSVDVCRYMVMDSVVVTGNTTLNYRGNSYAYDNMFNISPLAEQTYTRLAVIVSYDWNAVTLYPVWQETYPETGVDCTSVTRKPRVVMTGGRIQVTTEHGTYDVTGARE